MQSLPEIRQLTNGQPMLNGHNTRSLGALAAWYLACAASGALMLVVAAACTRIALSGRLSLDPPPLGTEKELPVFLISLAPVMAYVLYSAWTRRVRAWVWELKAGRMVRVTKMMNQP